MLVLTRKLNESIRIDDTVEIRILRIAGGKVRLGIQAPLDIHIVRGELKDTLSDERYAAAGLNSAARR